MDNESLRKLQQIVDEQRLTGRLDFLKIVESAHAAGMDIGTDEVRYLRSTLRALEHLLIYPAWLSKFIIEYQKQAKPKTLLDPWAGSLLLVPVTEALNPDVALGISRNLDELEVAAYVSAHTSITWVEGDTLNRPSILDNLAEQVGGGFDLILSCPPMGMPSTSLSLESDEGTITIHDSQEAVLILRSCIHLAPDGVGLFVVNNRFFRPDDPRSVYANLTKFGLNVDAALALPEGTFLPHTSISTTLVSIRRVQSKRLFVSELSDDPKRNSDVLKNLNARKSGPNVSLGALVERERFRGYRALSAEEKARDLARGLGITPTPLSSIALEINLPRGSESQGYLERPNSVYLPLLNGQGNVVSSRTQAQLKHRSFHAQIVLNPDKAIDVYVAGFLNTSLGRLLREAALTGNYAPRTSRQVLADIQVYLPERETQLAIINADTRVANLQNELAELRDRLWAQPRRLKEVVRDIDAVNREERLSDWYDTLPFPLASVLWTYSSSSEEDHKQRYEHLLHFFEALAEFLAAVLLSGFRTDPKLFSEKQRSLRSALLESDLAKGTFGTWIRIAENLAKDVRTLLNGKSEDQDRCKTMFRTSDRDVLGMLFNSEIISVLQHANELRNQWTGHGGVVSQREAQARLTLLESYLSKVRGVYSYHWGSYQLVKPGTNRFAAGVYHYQVERIMGTRTPFERVEVSTDVPMEYGELYLLGAAERNPLKLFPLVKVMPSPKTAANACYFYNRVDRDKLRFVSYHFEEDADIIDVFPDTADAVRTLLGDGEVK